MDSNEDENMQHEHEGAVMEQLMAHLNDDKFGLHLVRFHNSQSRNGLRDMVLYVTMLVERFDNTTDSQRRVKPAEIELIKTMTENILQHFLIAEETVEGVTQDHAQAMRNAAISETDDISRQFNGMVDHRPARKMKSQGA